MKHLHALLSIVCSIFLSMAVACANSLETSLSKQLASLNPEAIFTLDSTGTDVKCDSVCIIKY